MNNYREPSFFNVENLTKNFGGFTAVSKLSFMLVRGEIMGLVGPNGAGKTTVFNLITGFLKPSQGRVVFRDKEIIYLKPHEIARGGLVRTFQLNKIFSSLSVEENIRIGCYCHERGGLMRFLFNPPKSERDNMEEAVNKILDLIGLGELRNKIAADLSYGDHKRLGIGISLGAKPTLLLLDEPFAGMNPVETQKCMDILRRIVEQGTTILLVDHDMRAVMGICERILVLNFGKKIAEGKPEEIRENPEVVTTYLGSIKVA
jgi:branched-chain amino acid transport system ATP-binding protein